MKKQHIYRYVSVLLLVVFCLIVVPQVQPAQATTLTRCELESRVHKRINEYRTSIGLETMKRKKKIVREARGHSANMASGEIELSHSGFSDRFAALQEEFDGLTGAAENVAYTSRDTGIARKIVENWLDSSAHRKNIKNPEYNLTGVGMSKKNGRYYFTQIFLTQSE